MKNLLIGMLLIIIGFNCKKKEDSKGTNAFSTTSEQKANRMSDISTVEKLAEDSYESPTKQDIPPQTAEKITPTTNPVTELSKDRLLEYNVSLTYNCKDFYTSRKNLLEIIKSSAIIKNSSTTANIYHPSLHTTLLVKTESLYQVLIELDKIGTLTSENIQAEDLTELNVFNKIKKERETHRIDRRGIAATQVSSAYQNWKDREDALERSENQLDDAKLQEWKITDRVTWSKVTIYLSGPELPKTISIPTYRNALVGSLNAFLSLLYYFLWILPFLLIILGIIILIRKFGWRPNKL